MEHKGTVTLETERLILRKMKLEDAPLIFKNWTSDEEVSKYMRWSTHKSILETENWIKEEIKNYPKNDYYCWLIELKEIKEPIGSLGAYLRPEEDNRYEIGYNIAKKHWRKGYATEAVRAMMNYLKNTVGIKKFMCAHAKQNLASGAVMQKVGFKYVKDCFYESFDKTKKYDSKVYYLDIL